MEKMKNLLMKAKNIVKKNKVAFTFAFATIFSLVSGTSASASATEFTSADFKPITDAITGSLNVGQIATVVGIILSSCLGLYVFQWGARKLVRAVISAFERGKIKL